MLIRKIRVIRWANGEGGVLGSRESLLYTLFYSLHRLGVSLYFIFQHRRYLVNVKMTFLFKNTQHLLCDTVLSALQILIHLIFVTLCVLFHFMRKLRHLRCWGTWPGLQLTMNEPICKRRKYNVKKDFKNSLGHLWVPGMRDNLGLHMVEVEQVSHWEPLKKLPSALPAGRAGAAVLPAPPSTQSSFLLDLSEAAVAPSSNMLTFGLP